MSDSRLILLNFLSLSVGTRSTLEFLLGWISATGDRWCRMDSDVRRRKDSPDLTSNEASNATQTAQTHAPVTVAPCKPKGGVKVNPMVDLGLTLFFLLLCASSFITIAGNPAARTSFTMGFAITVSLIKTTKMVMPFVGRFLSRRYLSGPAFGDPLSKPRTLAKWTDQSWQLLIHLITSSWEYLVLRDRWDTWENPAVLITPDNFQENFWEHRPSPSLLRLYMAQLGIWIATCFSHRFLEKTRRKDYVLMFTHHVVTISLVLGSHVRYHHSLGLLVLFLHDLSDIPIDVVKMLNYANLTDRKACFLGEIIFVFNLVSWIYLRLYYFPFRIIRMLIFDVYRMYCAPLAPFASFFEGPPWCLERSFPSGKSLHGISFLYDWTIMTVLLSLLAVMHVLWFWLLLRIITKVLKQTSNTGHLVKEEYEGDSDSD
eukprot:g21279.t1